MEDDVFWTVAQAQPSQETRALRNLHRQGFEAFFPFYFDETKHKRQVIRPVFSGYVFIKLTFGCAWGPINSTYGIHRLLTYNSEGHQTPHELPEEFINGLGRYLKSTNALNGSLELQANTRVRVIRGPLVDQEALITWSMDNRVGLLFAIMNRQVEIEFLADDIMILPPADK